MAKTVSKARKAKQAREKKIKMAFTISGIVLAVLVIAAVLTFIFTQPAGEGVRGNSINNISSYGKVVEYGDGYIYADGTAIYDDKGNEICKADAYYLNIYEDYLYFTVNSEKGDAGYIARIKPDGTDMTKIVDHRGEYLTIVDGKMYFCYNYAYISDDREADGIYSVNLDGSDLERISLDEAYKMTVYGNKIYFINKMDNYKLYSIKTDGTGRDIVVSAFTYTYGIADGRIYTATEDGIVSTGLDGAGLRVVMDLDMSDIFVIDNIIYFCNVDVVNSAEENRSLPLMCINTKGEEMDQVLQTPVTALMEANGKLFFTPLANEDILMIYDPETGEITEP